MFPLSKRDKAVAKITFAVLAPALVVGAVSLIFWLLGKPLPDGVAHDIIVAINIFAGLIAGRIYTNYRESTQPKLPRSA